MQVVELCSFAVEESSPISAESGEDDEDDDENFLEEVVAELISGQRRS